jgi:carotenoid cleavage dioxygenase-like enzyme
MPETDLAQRVASLFDSSSEVNEEIADVHGELPSWLHGTYLRTGPGLFDLGKGFTMNHLFDGYAILTKFDIMGDKIKLKMKYLESEAYKRALTAKKPMVLEFGTRYDLTNHTSKSDSTAFS